jgi:hypothetical protein
MEVNIERKDKVNKVIMVQTVTFRSVRLTEEAAIPLLVFGIAGGGVEDR